MTRHPLSHRQARQLMDTAYLAAATALLVLLIINDTPARLAATVLQAEQRKDW